MLSVYLSQTNKGQIEWRRVDPEPTLLVFTVQNLALRFHTLHGYWSFGCSSSQVFCLFGMEVIGGQYGNGSQQSQLVLSPVKREKLLPESERWSGFISQARATP